MNNITHGLACIYEIQKNSNVTDSVFKTKFVYLPNTCMGQLNKITTDQSILITAKNLFWKHGIRRITVEEICRVAGVSKMTFYRSFANKNEIAGKVLEKVVNENMLAYKNIMKQDIPFSEKIMEVVELKHTASKTISIEFLKDIHNDKSGLRKQLNEAQQNSQDIFVKDLKAAQKKGQIRKDLKIEFINYMLNSLNEKMMDDDFLAMFKDTQDAIMEATNFFFYGILSKGNDEV